MNFNDGSIELEVEYYNGRLYFSIMDFAPMDVEGSYCSINLPVTQELVDRLSTLVAQLQVDLLDS